MQDPPVWGQGIQPLTGAALVLVLGYIVLILVRKVFGRKLLEGETSILGEICEMLVIAGTAGIVVVSSPLVNSFVRVFQAVELWAAGIWEPLKAFPWLFGLLVVAVAGIMYFRTDHFYYTILFAVAVLVLAGLVPVVFDGLTWVGYAVSWLANGVNYIVTQINNADVCNVVTICSPSTVAPPVPVPAGG